MDDKKLPAQQAMKRALPPSFNAPPNPSRNVADYTSPAVGNKNSFGDGYYRGAHAEIGIQRGVNGVRILPPSMTHGPSAPPLQYGGQSDPIHRVVGIVEDRNSENDERLIYQAALRVFILNSIFSCACFTVSCLDMIAAVSEYGAINLAHFFRFMVHYTFYLVSH